MNTYKISFTRENGVHGYDHFTAATESQARKDFAECYRHGIATIDSVELTRTDAPATKQQERYALTMPKELQKAHIANDKAVMQAYGLSVGNTSEADCVAFLMKRYQELTEKK